MGSAKAPLGRTWHVRVAGLIGLCLFLLFGVYETAFHGLPIDPDRSIAIYYMVVSALAPWYYAVDSPAGPMLLFAVHTTTKAHLLRWAVFSLASGAIWFAALWGIQATFRRLKPRPHWLTVSGLLAGLSPILEIGPAIADLATSSVHGAGSLQGPWWWLAQITGWPGAALARLIMGSGWIPSGATPGSSSTEYLAQWSLLLLVNVIAWTTAGFVASRLFSGNVEQKTA